MNPFSSVLEVYMREKDIRTYSIAQFCGIDRSNMYKIISGKRNPASEEIVEKIAEYMRLNPTERNQLLEAYQVTIMGYDTYHRRKSVQDFFLSFSENSSKKEESFSREYMTINIDEKELNHFHGNVIKDRQLRELISSVFNIEIKKQNGKVCLLMQPESNHIMDILVSAGERKRDLTIEHIFCLSNTNDIISNKRDYNLLCLKNILPMFVQCKCEYKPYYYYDNIVSRNNKFNLLSSMILTSEYAVIFSMEGKYGMLFSDKDTIQHLHMLFQSLKEDASLMVNKINTLEKQLKSFQKINFMTKGVSFQPESCLIPMLTTTFLEKYLNRGLLAQQQIKEKLFQYVYSVQKTAEMSKTMFVFTENGIRRFADTGRISELPESIYYPLEYGDRLILIRRLIRECEKGKYQMLRPDIPIAETKISLYSGMQEGYLLLPINQDDRIFMELRESGLLNAFRDYFENIDKKYLYSIEETVDILKKLVMKKSFS